MPSRYTGGSHGCAHRHEYDGSYGCGPAGSEQLGYDWDEARGHEQQQQQGAWELHGQEEGPRQWRDRFIVADDDGDTLVSGHGGRSDQNAIKSLLPRQSRHYY